MNGRLLFLVPLFACGGRVADEMEAALEDINDAIAISLLVAEPNAWADVNPETTATVTTTGGTGGTGLTGSSPSGLRHGAAGDCPELTRTDIDATRYAVEADYGNGCVSGSGLTPTVLSGVVDIEVEAEQVGLNFTSWKADLSRRVGGTVSGELGTEPDTVAVSGTVHVDDGEGFRYEATLSLDLDLAGDEVVIDGTVEPVGSDPVRLDGLRIRLTDIPGQCPRPYLGVATVTGDGPDRVVDFGVGSPGFVAVQRKGRTSQPTELCAFASEVF